MNSTFGFAPEIEWLFFEGCAAYDGARYLDALHVFSKVIRLDKGSSGYAFEWRAACHAALGHLYETIVDSNAALLLLPALSTAYFYRGYANQELARTADAERDFDQCITLDPQFAGAYVRRASLYQRTDRHALAVEDLTRALEINEALGGNHIDADDVLNSRGLSYHALAMFERAVEDFTEALRINENDSFTLNSRGFAYTSLYMFDRALEDLSRAVQLQPDFGNAWYVCVAHTRQIDIERLCNRIQSSRVTLSRIRVDALTRIVRLRAFRSNRGFVYLAMGLTEQAQADFRKAIEMLDAAIAQRATNANALYARGRAYRGLGDLDRSIADLTRSLELEDDSRSRVHRGYSFYQAGRYAEAQADFALVKKKSPTSTEPSTVAWRSVTHTHGANGATWVVFVVVAREIPRYLAEIDQRLKAAGLGSSRDPDAMRNLFLSSSR